MRLYKISELGEIKTGKTPPTKNENFYGGHYPFYTPTDMGSIRYLEQTERSLSEEGINSVSSSKIPENTILVSCIGTVGKVAISGKEGVTNQDVNSVIPGPEFDPLFLYYLMSSKKSLFRRFSLSGSVQPLLNKTDFSNIELLVPDLSTQKSIAHILGTLDDKIEVNQEMNRTLEEIARAIFKSWFVDFDPVHAKAERRPTGLPSDISDLFPDELVESELGQIPKGWETKALDDIGVFKNGLALQKFPAKDGMAKLPVVKIAQLRKGNTLGDNPLASNVPSEYIINDGDFIFSWSGSLLAKYWVGGQGALNQHLFKVEERSAPLWLVANWVLQHLPEFRIIAKSKATTMGHIKREHLKEAICVVPSAGILNWGQEVIAPLIDRSVIALKENRILSSLRDTLLPKLISGEIRVPDAEKFLEETAI